MSVETCASCKQALSLLGNYVKTGAREKYHLGCFLAPKVNAAFQEGRQSLLIEQQAARTAEREAAERAAKVKAEQDAIKAEALRVLNAEKARVLAATKKATEELRAKDEASGTPIDRFAQVAEEIELGADEIAAEQARKAAEQAKEQARQEAESARAQALKAQDPCVRCGKPGPHGDYHPRHCSACWNSAAPDAGMDKTPIAVPQFNRPIELE
jgi:colicin import membrane protein